MDKIIQEEEKAKNVKFAPIRQWGKFNKDSIKTLDIQKDLINFEEINKEIKEIDIPDGKDLVITMSVSIQLSEPKKPEDKNIKFAREQIKKESHLGV